MKNKILTTLAVIGFAVAAQATPVSWDFQQYGVGSLGVGTKTFTSTSGGVLITAYASAGDTLYAKNNGAGEVGLGLVGLPNNEITPGHFIQFGLPTTPATSLVMTFLQSIQANESATLWYSTVLGTLGAQVGTLNGDGSFDFSAYSTGYIGVSAGAGDVLVGTVSADLRTPDGGSTMLLMGGALTALGLIRRKLTA